MFSSFRDLWGNSVVLLVSRILSKLATMGVVIVTARSLGVEEFGLLNSILAVTVFAGIISDFGMVMPSIRSIASSGGLDGSIVLDSITFRMVTSTAAVVVNVSAGILFGLPVITVLILSVASIFELTGTTFVRAFEGANDFRLVSRFTVIERLLYGALSIGSVLIFGTVTAFAVGVLIAHSVFLTLTYRAFHQKFATAKSSITGKGFGMYAAVGLPFLLTTVFSNIFYKSDTMFISQFTGNHNAGLYNAAMRLLDAQMMIPFTVMTTVFPRLSRLHFEQSKDYRAYFIRHMFLMASAGIFFCLATYVGAPYFIPLIYSGDFSASVMILQLLSLMLVFVFMNVLFSQTLVSIHKERVFTGVMLFNAVLSIGGKWFFVPEYGITSAAVVRVALEAFSCVVMGGFIFYYVFYRREHLPLQ